MFGRKAAAARKRQAVYGSLHAAFTAVIAEAEAEDAERELLYVWTYKRYVAQAMLDALEKS